MENSALSTAAFFSLLGRIFWVLIVKGEIMRRMDLISMPARNL